MNSCIAYMYRRRSALCIIVSASPSSCLLAVGAFTDLHVNVTVRPPVRGPQRPHSISNGRACPGTWRQRCKLPANDLRLSPSLDRSLVDPAPSSPPLLLSLSLLQWSGTLLRSPGATSPSFLGPLSLSPRRGTPGGSHERYHHDSWLRKAPHLARPSPLGRRARCPRSAAKSALGRTFTVR